MKTNERTFTIKVLKKGKVVSQTRTKSMRRFLSICRLTQFKDLMKFAYIKVAYGMKKDYRGNLVESVNEGIYGNKKELLYAAKSFCNEQ